MSTGIYRPLFRVIQSICGVKVTKSFPNPKEALKYLNEITELWSMDAEPRDPPYIAIHYVIPEKGDCYENQSPYTTSLSIEQDDEASLQRAEEKAKGTSQKGTR